MNIAIVRNTRSSTSQFISARRNERVFAHKLHFVSLTAKFFIIHFTPWCVPSIMSGFRFSWWLYISERRYPFILKQEFPLISENRFDRYKGVTYYRSIIVTLSGSHHCIILGEMSINFRTKHLHAITQLELGYSLTSRVSHFCYPLITSSNTWDW